MAIDEKIQNEKTPEALQDNPEYGLMDKIRSYAKSKKGKITAGIGALAFAGTMYATQPNNAYAQGSQNNVEIKESNRTELPCTEGWEFFGRREMDRNDRIPGKESIVEGYTKGNISLFFQYFKGHDNPGTFWFYDRDKEKTFNGYVDTNNDRVFDKHIPRGEWNIDLDYEAWGFK